MSQQAQVQPSAQVTPGQGLLPATGRCRGTMCVEGGGAAESRAVLTWASSR